jgi:3-oxoacyl-[acyl-carrier-protein] synthase II
MGSNNRTDVVITGAASLVCAPRATLAPSRWAGTTPKLQRMDRLCALALVACDGALVDAGAQPLDPAQWNGERIAVVLGTAYGCHATNEEYYRGVIASGPGGASPRLFAYTLPSSPVGEISIHYGIQGPASALTPGLTAGVDVIAAGLRELSTGRADRVLVAAAEVATPLLERLTAGNGSTIGRNGSTIPLADGAAALFLERTADAAARGAVPRGRLLATATQYAAGARGRAVADAAQHALARADLGPGAIVRVFGAPVDIEAVRSLGIEAPAAPADSDAVGETLGAAPLIAAVRALDETGGLFLIVAGDPEGAGSAALLQT